MYTKIVGVAMPCLAEIGRINVDTVIYQLLSIPFFFITKLGKWKSSKSFQLIIPFFFLLLAAFGQVDAQVKFNGTYKAVSNGVTYVMRLNNTNGKVAGTIRNTNVAGAGSIITAHRLNDQSITGIQREMGMNIKFIATEENDEIIWELKGWLLELTYSRADRTFRFRKVTNGSGSSDSQPSPEIMSDHDPALVGSWLHIDYSTSVNGSGRVSEGLRLEEDGSCQTSSSVTVGTETSGSTDEWQGSHKWRTENGILTITENGNEIVTGSYMIHADKLIITIDGKRKFYSRM